jgi:hypothetical protein
MNNASACGEMVWWPYYRWVTSWDLDGAVTNLINAIWHQHYSELFCGMLK